MGIQILKTPGGEELVVMPRHDYDALIVQLAHRPDWSRSQILKEAEKRAIQPLPEDVAVAVLAGESLLMALRQWRGKSAMEIASATGISLTQLEAYEAGQREVPAPLRHELAEALSVPQGWLG